MALATYKEAKKPVCRLKSSKEPQNAAEVLARIASIWRAATLSSVGVVLRYLFGPNYKQAMYGQYLKRTKFLLDEGVINTSHCSFGVVPKPVLATQRQLQEEMEACPVAWFRYNSQRLWKKSLRLVAKFIGASVNNLVFIPNVTSGINTVLRCLDIQEGDGVLVTNHTSSAVQLAAQEVCGEKKAKLLVLNIAFPTSDMTGSVDFYAEDIVAHYNKVLQENPMVKVAIVDAITCGSSLRLPLEHVIEVCRSHGVHVLVNGEQAVGQIPLNLESLAADFVVGSLNEWLFTPRGCAILWVGPRFHDVITSEAVTWKYKGGLYERPFQSGNMDITPFLTATAAIKFYLQMGGMDGIISYNSQLVSWASTMIARKWETEVLPVPESMRAPCMAVVRMPDVLSIAYGTTHESADQIVQDLYEKYQVTATVTLISGSLWCQLSVQVYNVYQDYNQLADKVLELKDSCMEGYRPRLFSNNNLCCL